MFDQHNLLTLIFKDDWTKQRHIILTIYWRIFSQPSLPLIPTIQFTAPLPRFLRASPPTSAYFNPTLNSILSDRNLSFIAIYISHSNISLPISSCRETTWNSHTRPAIPATLHCRNSPSPAFQRGRRNVTLVIRRRIQLSRVQSDTGVREDSRKRRVQECVRVVGGYPRHAPPRSLVACVSIPVSFVFSSRSISLNTQGFHDNAYYHRDSRQQRETVPLNSGVRSTSNFCN